ncbi:MAG: hypothetical protein M3Q98_07995 [Actinomycetota bacterium]|nr:hypothetical protein [Actinomycetota bacterium]
MQTRTPCESRRADSHTFLPPRSGSATEPLNRHRASRCGRPPLRCFNVGESKVNYTNPDRAPLLFIAGGNDNIVPAKVNHANARRYKGKGTVTEVKEFPGRTHYIVGQDGWEEVADYALAWAARH